MHCAFVGTILLFCKQSEKMVMMHKTDKIINKEELVNEMSYSPIFRGMIGFIENCSIGLDIFLFLFHIFLFDISIYI